MKIVVTSDIHLGITTEDELEDLIEEISCLEPDVLIAAGDLGEFGGYFVGADFAVSDSVLVGIRQYMTEGDGEGDPQFDAIVLVASFSF